MQKKPTKRRVAKDSPPRTPDKRIPRHPKGVRYSAETWADVKSAYESGQYKSIDDIYESYKSEGKTVPTRQCMATRCARDKWAKDKLKPQIAEAMQDKFRRLAAEIGLGDKEIVQYMFRMVEDPQYRNHGLQRLMDVTGIKAPLKVAKTDSDGADVIADTIFVIPANGFEPKKK